MAVNMGGHWTTTLFAGLKDEGMFKEVIQSIIYLFGEATDVCAWRVQAMLADAEQEEWKDWRNRVGRLPLVPLVPKTIVVRTYLPGHKDCQEYRASNETCHNSRWGW